jgi:hypothetical protein
MSVVREIRDKLRQIIEQAQDLEALLAKSSVARQRLTLSFGAGWVRRLAKVERRLQDLWKRLSKGEPSIDAIFGCSQDDKHGACSPSAQD